VRWVVIATSIVGCGVGCGDNLGGAPPDVDAPATSTAMTFRIGVVPSEPADRPPASPAPTVLIDGSARLAYEEEYPSEELALGRRHSVELRIADTVVASYEVVISKEGCLFQVEQATLYSQTICSYDSGDLRFGSDEARGDTTCVGDGFCLASCRASDCGTGERCTSRASSIDPFASHLACAPIGNRKLGQSCALIDDPAGAYDNCGADLLCVGGTCRTTCVPSAATPSCTGCSYVPGHAPEIGICP
jgi:hypothetical protein